MQFPISIYFFFIESHCRFCSNIQTVSISFCVLINFNFKKSKLQNYKIKLQNLFVNAIFSHFLTLKFSIKYFHHKNKLTCRGVHRAAITDNKTISAAAFTQLEERILDLDHRFQQVLLKLESCNKRLTKKNIKFHPIK